MTENPPIMSENSNNPLYTEGTSEDKTKWPKWNGETATFDLFFRMLKTRANHYAAEKRSSEMTCYNIIQSLPEDKRNRVARWYDEPWEYEKFLEKVKSQFEDKQARQAAGSKLSRMRMGAS
jgi:hypothetical protein